MLSFFVALFGGMYYGGRLLYEKSVAKSHDDFRDYVRRIDEMITAPIEVERQGEDIFLRRINLEETLDSMSDDMQFVFGDNWKSLFFDFDPPCRLDFTSYVMGFDSIFHIAYWLWITKRGYSHGTCHHITGINPYFPIAEIKDEFRAEIAIKACFIMERNMQRAHPKYINEFRIIKPLYTYKDGRDCVNLQHLDWTYRHSKDVPRISLWRLCPDGSYLFNFGIGHSADYQTVWVN